MEYDNDKTNNETTSSNNEETKDRVLVCSMCRRTESQVNRMFVLHPGICICDDCMQKTMDTLSGGGSLSILGLTPKGKENDDNKPENGNPNDLT